MEYICIMRLKKRHLSGDIIIPSGTKCNEKNKVIYRDGKPICYSTSQIAHDYFARNDDGKGMERGKLTQEIQRILSKHDRNHQKRWDTVWDDTICQKYKRKEYDDFWLWNHDFFNANIEDLKYIYNLVKTKWQIAHKE